MTTLQRAATFSLFALVTSWATLAQSATIVMRQGWQIQDSNQVTATPSVVSTPGFATGGWIATTVPNTVMGALAAQPGLGFDPFVAENLLKLPGSGSYYTYQTNFMLTKTPDTSPFGRAWYYRTEFTLPTRTRAHEQYVDLQLKGATYGAEIWMNGTRVASSAQTAGTYRQPSFDITPFLHEGPNALAILVGNPQPGDLTSTWVDWAPAPQDKNMGLWQDVVLQIHGPVSIAHPQVTTQLTGPESALKAALTIEAELKNASALAVTGHLRAVMGRENVEQIITLQPHETRVVQFFPTAFAELNLDHPALWWPAQMGSPTLQDLQLSFEQDGVTSDQTTLRYGIRQITSELTPAGSRLFRINRKPILIRGGGWASDLFLRFSPARTAKELQYVLDLGLNTIRLEGRFEPDSFMQLTDRYGILVMTGWACCGAWQDSKKWNATTQSIAQASLRDQIYAFRAHPSTLAFLYGSDEAPTPTTEKTYLDTLGAYHWPNPALASAAETSSLAGKSGFKMRGPYDYVPPSYWTVDKGSFGGAWGFNTETSPGASIPPIESLREFIPPEHLWPIDSTWIFHTGENEFHNLTNFVGALNKRFGESRSVEEFVEKAQVMGYDNHRAMFEAFNKNKYAPATGVIQWMLNNPWPSLIWHLYDYYLRPGGTYFGAKEANRPLHIQYSYDDQTVYLINQTPRAAAHLGALVEVYDLKMNLIYSHAMTLAAGPDSTIKILDLPPLKPSSKTYFVRLSLDDASGAVIDRNFYWLSTQREIYDWAHSSFFTTPLLQEGDLRELKDLPQAQVSVTTDFDEGAKNGKVVLKNTGSTLAFFVHLKAVQGPDEHELLPILWQDNDVTLLPGETRTLAVSFSLASMRRGPVSVKVDGWNL